MDLWDWKTDWETRDGSDKHGGNGEWSNSKCMLKDKGINLSEVMKLIKG